MQGKKPRPLSANRKSTNTKALDSTQETKAVIEAMRLENERMDREKARAKVTSAPEKSQVRSFSVYNYHDVFLSCFILCDIYKQTSFSLYFQCTCISVDIYIKQ